MKTLHDSATRGGTASAEIIRRLRGRMATDSGFAASLRRSAGRSLGASRALTAWYDFVADLPEPIRPMRDADVDRLFLLATLFAHDRGAYRSFGSRVEGDAPPSKGGDTGFSGSASNPAGPEGATAPPTGGAPVERSGTQRRSLGWTLSEIRRLKPVMRDSLTRRLAILLDASLGEGGGSLEWRLRQAVKLALSSGAAIDWAALLDDLRNWDRPDQRVQRRWARDFVAPHEPRPARAITTTSDATPARTHS